MTTRYANDVVASCAFGLKVDSHLDLDNEFYARGKEASTFSFWQLMMFFGFASFPKVMKVRLVVRGLAVRGIPSNENEVCNRRDVMYVCYWILFVWKLELVCVYKPSVNENITTTTPILTCDVLENYYKQVRTPS